MYTPLKYKASSQYRRTQTMMAPAGENLQDLPQLLDVKNAQIISNYTINGNGKLEKRGGEERIFDVAGNIPITDFEKYTDDVYIYSYGTKTAAYNKTTGTSTIIKSNWTSGSFSGQRYGDYFFIGNGIEKIHRISQTLAYDAQTGNFTVGLKITGATSGATAIILQDSDSGATGTLTLGSITGTFQDNEIITDTSTGSATVNGTLTYTATEISGAPKAGILKVIGNRLFAGRTFDDNTAVHYSQVDDGTNPPFTNWTVDTLANGPGKVFNRIAGRVNSIEAFGTFIVVFADAGKYAFYINTQDVGGTLTKIDIFQMSRVDFGGAIGAISTPKGVFYVNEAGLWALASIGEQNISLSDQDVLQSTLLGDKYFTNITLDHCDIEYDARTETILVACAQSSARNNLVIVYNTHFKAFSRITGWNINCFLNDDQTFYGASSVGTRAWQLFTGSDDDGFAIGTQYRQELNTGAPMEYRSEVKGAYVQGFLSEDGPITVTYDIYNVNGQLVPNKLGFTWTTQYSEGTAYGYGQESYGTGSYGGNIDYSGTVESFDGNSGRVNNWQRIIIDVTSGDKLPHVINWISLNTKIKAPIRRRKMTQSTPTLS